MEASEFNLAKISSQSILEALINNCVQKNLNKGGEVDALIYKPNGTIVALTDKTCSYDVLTNPFVGSEGGLYDLLVNIPGKETYIPLSDNLVLICNEVGFKATKKITDNFTFGVPCISDGFFVSVGVGSYNSSGKNFDDSRSAYNTKSLSGRTIVMFRGCVKKEKSRLDELIVPTIVSKGTSVTPFTGKITNSDDNINVLSVPLNLKLFKATRSVFVLENIVRAAMRNSQFTTSAKMSMDSEMILYDRVPTFS